MYRWLLYGHLIGVGSLVLGTGAYWLATEALTRGPDPSGRATLLLLAERGIHLLLAGGVILLGFGVALANHLGVLTEPWIMAAFFLVGLQGLTGRLLAERSLRQTKRAERGSSHPATLTYQAAVRRMNVGARASLPILAELELLMVVKPEPLPLVWSLVAALGLAVLLGWTGFARPLRDESQRSWS